MKSCSQTIKSCGLKGVAQVAHLNGISRITIYRAYESDYPRFKQYIFNAINKLYEQHRKLAEANLKGVNEQ